MKKNIHDKNKKTYKYSHKEKLWPESLGINQEIGEKIDAIVHYIFAHDTLTEEQKKEMGVEPGHTSKHSIDIEKIFNHIQPETLEEAFYMGNVYGKEVAKAALKMGLDNAMEDAVKSAGENKFKEIFGDRKKKDEEKVVN